MADLFQILSLAGALVATPQPVTPHVHYDGPGAYGELMPHAATVPLPAFDVTYHGGAVQNQTTTYAIYWYPSSAGSPTAYMAGIDAYLGSASNSPLYGVAASYSTRAAPISQASTFAGGYRDAHAFPSTLDEAAIESELEADVASAKITPGLGTQFFLFLPSGAPFTPPAGATPFCGLHGYVSYQGKSSEPLIFALVPYEATPLCQTLEVSAGEKPLDATPGVDSAIANAAREQAEMVTDPLGNAWYDASYGEIGDLCFFDYGDPDILGKADLEIDKALYNVPEVWSQRAQACQPNMPAVAPPAAPVFPDVTWHGGPIQASTTTYAIYWGKAADFDSEFMTNTEQFLQDVGGSQWYANLTQYSGEYDGQMQTVTNSSTFGGGFRDTKNVPTGAVTKSDVVAEVARVVKLRPAWQIGITTEVFLFLPPGADSGSDFCSEHASTTLPDSSTPLVYAVLKYPSTAEKGCAAYAWGLPSPDGDTLTGNLISSMAHEMAEMVTDPVFDNGSGTGWHGPDSENEVADLCGGDFGRFKTTVPYANDVLKGHGYRLPAIYSVRAKACKPNF